MKTNAISSEEPFRTVLQKRWLPEAMVTPPFLDPTLPCLAIEPRYALLINPFYPKDPHASFGKHVLTPSLALTSFAAKTPSNWRLQYWDENLLQGSPPHHPIPQVVGITVPLTFARRAYALASWYRARGALVVLGGLHVLSCAEEAAPHADALAIGGGVQLWPVILRDVERAELKNRYHATDETEDRGDRPPRGSFLTSTSLIAIRRPRRR
jgi:hypothetical protein